MDTQPQDNTPEFLQSPAANKAMHMLTEMFGGVGIELPKMYVAASPAFGEDKTCFVVVTDEFCKRFTPEYLVTLLGRYDITAVFEPDVGTSAREPTHHYGTLRIDAESMVKVFGNLKWYSHDGKTLENAFRELKNSNAVLEEVTKPGAVTNVVTLGRFRPGTEKERS